MKTAVMILNWNGAAMLRRFLPSVVKNTPEAEIVVADNGSTDDSLELLRTDFPAVHVLSFTDNYGFAEGYNRAIRAVDCQYAVLLNSDVEVPEGWLAPLVAYMDSHKAVAACQPKLLSWHNRKSFEYAGAAGGYLDKLGYPYCRGRLFGSVEQDTGQYATTDTLHWATGACLIVRRELYTKVGGLDARFFAHSEEIDFCWRLRLMGYKIACVAESRVWHVGGATLPQGNPHKTYLNFRNNLLMLYKNLPERGLRSVMRCRFWLDGLAALEALMQGHIGDVSAIYRARRDFHRMRKEYKPLRNDIQAKAVERGTLLAPLSLLWQYYIKDVRSYTALR